MKPTTALVAGALLALSASPLVFAQQTPAPAPTAQQRETRHIRRDNRDIRQDKRDVHRDQRQINKDVAQANSKKPGLRKRICDMTRRTSATTRKTAVICVTSAMPRTIRVIPGN